METDQQLNTGYQNTVLSQSKTHAGEYEKGLPMLDSMGRYQDNAAVQRGEWAGGASQQPSGFLTRISTLFAFIWGEITGNHITLS